MQKMGSLLSFSVAPLKSCTPASLPSLCANRSGRCASTLRKLACISRGSGRESRSRQSRFRQQAGKLAGRQAGASCPMKALAARRARLLGVGAPTACLTLEGGQAGQLKVQEALVAELQGCRHACLRPAEILQKLLQEGTVQRPHSGHVAARAGAGGGTGRGRARQGCWKCGQGAFTPPLPH